jgi:hypothetical protein
MKWRKAAGFASHEIASEQIKTKALNENRNNKAPNFG